MVEVHVTVGDLAAYSAGQIITGEVTLPMDEDELREKVQSILKVEPKEEYFIASVTTDLNVNIYEHQSIYELEASIDIVENGEYILFRDADDEEELGRSVINMGLFGHEIPSDLERYINYEAIGSDHRDNTTGDFTAWGYCEVG